MGNIQTYWNFTRGILVSYYLFKVKMCLTATGNNCLTASSSVSMCRTTIIHAIQTGLTGLVTNLKLVHLHQHMSDTTCPLLIMLLDNIFVEVMTYYNRYWYVSFHKSSSNDIWPTWQPYPRDERAVPIMAPIWATLDQRKSRDKLTNHLRPPHQWSV